MSIPATPSPRAPFDMSSLQINLPFVRNSGEDELDKLMGRLNIHSSDASPSPMPMRRQSKDAQGVHHARSHSPVPASGRTTTLFVSHPRNSATESSAGRAVPEVGDVEAAFSLMTVQHSMTAPPTTPRRRRTRPSEIADLSTMEHLTTEYLTLDAGKSPRKPASVRKSQPGPTTPLKGSKPDFAFVSPAASPSNRWSPYAVPRFPSSESPSKRNRAPRAVSDSAAIPHKRTAGTSNQIFASASPTRCVACELPHMGLMHAPLCPLGMPVSPALSPASMGGLLTTYMKGCPACDFPGVKGYTHSRLCGVEDPPEDANAMDVDSVDDDVFS
ncbi:hypothetical protein AURDEDRAFT_129990 [Auricularia subglabra TFB-10046 SS5]|nr:hypothetical protein AURDEDRAFT_129990 [Auricularia subglabra TFB-10046 SS5]